MAGRDAALPLKLQTPPRWAHQVLAQPLELLNDHAHLEKKAATNALDLLNRWPREKPPESWVEAMTAVARDEVEHLAVVCRFVARRGGKLTKSHANPYATDLRQTEVPHTGDGNRELADRLLISGLIEAVLRTLQTPGGTPAWRKVQQPIRNWENSTAAYRASEHSHLISDLRSKNWPRRSMIRLPCRSAGNGCWNPKCA